LPKEWGYCKARIKQMFWSSTQRKQGLCVYGSYIKFKEKNAIIKNLLSHDKVRSFSKKSLKNISFLNITEAELCG